MKGPRRWKASVPPPKRPKAPRLGLVRFCVRCCYEIGIMGARLASYAALIAGVLLMLLDGREVVLDQIDPRLRVWAANALGTDNVEVGSIGFSLGAGEEPAGLVLNNVTIAGTDSTPSVTVPKIETGFQLMQSLTGQVRPTTIAVHGVSIALGRQTDGTLTVGSGDEDARALPLIGTGGQGAGFASLLQATDLFQEMDMLSRLTRVDIGELGIEYRDAVSGAVYRATRASAYVARDKSKTSAGFTADFDAPGADTPVRVQTTLHDSDVAGQTRVAFRFDGARPVDIAAQVSALSWLRLIEAEVNGSLAIEVSANGALADMSGSLEIGAGMLRPQTGAAVPFDGAQVYFDYDPAKDRLNISGLNVATDHGQFAASGTVMLNRSDAGDVSELVAQLDLDSITLAADSILSESVSFPKGAILARVHLEPFRIEIASIDLFDGEARAGLTGIVEAGEGGWEIALDASLSELTFDKLSALWPTGLRPGLRDWLVQRISAGRVTRFDAFFRHGINGAKGGLDFAFANAQAWILGDMPAVTAASGYGQLIDGRFDLVLDTGRTGGDGPGQGVDLAGSRMEIADVRLKPAHADIQLAGVGPVGKFLEIIDQPPLQFLTKAGRTPDLASGRAEVAAALRVPLRKGLTAKDIGVVVRADLQGVDAPDLVPNFPLRAETAQLSADNRSLKIWGEAVVGEVPMELAFERTLGEGTAPGRVEGRLAVTPAHVAALGIPLPANSFSGQGEGQFALDLLDGAPPRYSAEVALAGANVAIDTLNWRKSARDGGQLSLAGQLGDAPTVERISLSGPGLQLDGRLSLGRGGLTGATLSRLRLGRWLDAPVTWRPGAGGRSQVAVRGGRIDLRAGLPPQPEGEGGLDLTLRPDEIIVAEKIRLRDVDGVISSGSTPLGRFSASLNGAVPITGFLRAGGEVFLQSDDGGAALRAAGVFNNAFGGTLRVSFKDSNGPLSGVFSLKNATVVRAPALSTLLAEADARALARQVRGNGVAVEDAQGRFVIRDGLLTLNSARAVGPALGITMVGTYGLGNGRIDMEGVVSPLYAVNGIFQRVPLVGRLLGGRPGEGLLGANFRITGTGAAPQIAVNPLTLLTPGAAREIFQTRARN